MKKTLMTTVAAAAVVGFATLAPAQAPTGGDNDKGVMKSQGAQPQSQSAQPQQKSMGEGAQQGGAQSGEKKLDQKSGQSAQGSQGSTGAKPEGRMSTEDQNKATTQKSAQEPSKATSPKGAQEERGLKERGAQEEHGVNVKEPGKSSATTTSERTRASSVQLSQDQRSKIQTIIGKNRTARVNSNVKFNVSVGAVVPRSVHVEVLPRDIVEIVPEYDGFDYVVFGDEILIIDPRTLEIVAIIPA